MSNLAKKTIQKSDVNFLFRSKIMIFEMFQFASSSLSTTALIHWATNQSALSVMICSWREILFVKLSKVFILCLNDNGKIMTTWKWTLIHHTSYVVWFDWTDIQNNVADTFATFSTLLTCILFSLVVDRHDDDQRENCRRAPSWRRLADKFRVYIV